RLDLGRDLVEDLPRLRAGVDDRIPEVGRQELADVRALTGERPDEQLDRLDTGPGRRDDLLGDERGRLRQHVPEERTDLLGRRAKVVERLSDAREAAGKLREDALQEVLTEPRQRRAHVLKRPLHGLAGLQRRAAEAALHRVAERVEVDLAL